MDLLKGEINIDLIAVVGGAVFFIVWLIRLEGRVKSLASRQKGHDIATTSRFDKIEKSFDKLTDKHNDLERKMADDLSSIKSALARIEGRLSRSSRNSN